MGFRFRRSIRLLPGIRVNFGKTGSSLSIGGRGATVNLSARGTRTTVGLPGTGLSFSTWTRRKSPPAADPADVSAPTGVAPEDPPKPGFFATVLRLVGALFELFFACLVLAIQLGLIAALVGAVAWVAWRAASG
mgnify:FL=1